MQSLPSVLDRHRHRAPWSLAVIRPHWEYTASQPRSLVNINSNSNVNAAAPGTSYQPDGSITSSRDYQQLRSCAEQLTRSSSCTQRERKIRRHRSDVDSTTNVASMSRSPGEVYRVASTEGMIGKGSNWLPKACRRRKHRYFGSEPNFIQRSFFSTAE